MKKLFFAVGAILIILGFILAVNYNVAKNMRKIEIVGKEFDTCEIIVYLNKGDKFRVICSPPSSWGDYFGEWDRDDVIPYNHRHVWFEIVDPNGTITEFNTAWTRYSSTNQPLDIPLSRCFVNVTVLGEGLEVEGQYPTYIGGIAKISGNYTIRIPLDEYGYPIIYPSPLSDPDPPAYLAVEKETPVVTRPYMFLLPVGISVSAIGIVISTWSIKKEKHRYLRKKKILTHFTRALVLAQFPMLEICKKRDVLSYPGMKSAFIQVLLYFVLKRNFQH